MSSDNPPSGPPGDRGRRRTGPTIDLEATEIASKPAMTEAGAEASPPPETGSAKTRWLPPHWPWRTIGAGAGGVVLVAVAIFFASRFVGGDGAPGPGPGANPIEERLARLERQVRELAGRTPPPAVDPKVIDDLVSRIAKLEARLAYSFRNPANQRRGSASPARAAPGDHRTPRPAGHVW